MALFVLGPRQLRVIEKVDEYQESRLDVIATGGVVAPTLVHRGKNNVSTKLPKILFDDVLATLVVVARGKAEIDKVESI